MTLQVVKARSRKIPGRPKGGSRSEYELADKFFSRLNRRAFADLNGILEGDDLERVARAVRNKDGTLAIRALPSYDPADSGQVNAYRKLEADLRQTYRDVMRGSGKKALARLDIPVQFDLKNPRSVAWIETQSTRLTRQIVQGSAANILSIVRSGFVDGLTIEDMKRLIKPHIGLHPTQAQAVQRRLSQSLAQGVKPEQAAKQAATYSRQLLSQRAERIARTETIAAEAQGVIAGWDAAAVEGYIDRRTQKQEWISGPRETGVCRICAPLDKRKVLLGTPWRSDIIGEIWHPPAHVSCRCAIGLAF